MRLGVGSQRVLLSDGVMSGLVGPGGTRESVYAELGRESGAGMVLTVGWCQGLVSASLSVPLVPSGCWTG